jgi:predicted NAD/FAD-binding protein
MGRADLDSVLGQRRNLLRPKFGLLVRDVMIFNAQAQEHGGASSRANLDGLIRQAGSGRMVPPLLSAAHVGRDLELPALRDDAFSGAHSGAVFRQSSILMSFTGQPQWRTVTGDRRNMSAALPRPFAHRIRTNCAALAVTAPRRRHGKVRSRMPAAARRFTTRW